MGLGVKVCEEYNEERKQSVLLHEALANFPFNPTNSGVAAPNETHNA